MNYHLNFHAHRAIKARYIRRFRKLSTVVSFTMTITAALGGIASLASGHHYGWSLVGVASLGVVYLSWLTWDLEKLPSAQFNSGVTALDQLLPASVVARYTEPMSALTLWRLIEHDWQTQFILIRLQLPPEMVAASMASEPLNDEFWVSTIEIAKQAGLDCLSEGSLATSLITSTKGLNDTLTKLKIKTNDFVSVLDWLGRTIHLADRNRKFFGGIGRDWASGFTPTLERYGSNFSQTIESGGYRFEAQAESPIADQLVTALAARPGGVVITGPTGVGKTTLIYALAQRLLEGKTAGDLAYHQVVSLNASLILSTARDSGNAEQLVLMLLAEAVQAGNIILALDEAQLFFGEGTGSINLAQILLPIIQNRRLDLILTMTPSEWQKLSSSNPTLAGQFTRLTMPEPSEAETIPLIQDYASHLETRRQLLATYEAITSAYRLSGRYNPDEAYPGRALKLLEAAFSRPEGSFVTESSVEQAIESTYGVKAGTARGAESQTLLALEDRIHERMINQTRAVTVVASAIRRARAGVANPKRPIGSFLFLGPTGVGKTELARSLAAVYFNDETNMVRLDMSEYQRPDDVQRILADTGTSGSSFLATMRQRPFSVVLLDEIEKAHPEILNLLLQLLDEGNLTDVAGHAVSFKDAIIIATSNAGADEIRTRIAAGESLENFEDQFTDSLISSGQFKPELLNRFDEIVLFRPLSPDELSQVVRIMLDEINRTLQPQGLTVELTPEAVAKVVARGNDPRLGARPMRRALQRMVEDVVANRVLRGDASAGSTIKLDATDLPD